MQSNNDDRMVDDDPPTTPHASGTLRSIHNQLPSFSQLIASLSIDQQMSPIPQQNPNILHHAPVGPTYGSYNATNIYPNNTYFGYRNQYVPISYFYPQSTIASQPIQYNAYTSMHNTMVFHQPVQTPVVSYPISTPNTTTFATASSSASTSMATLLNTPVVTLHQTHNTRSDIYGIAKEAKEFLQNDEKQKNATKAKPVHFSGSTVFSASEIKTVNNTEMSIFKNSETGYVGSNIEDSLSVRYQRLQFPSIPLESKEHNFLRRESNVSGKSEISGHAETNSLRHYHLFSANKKVSRGEIPFHIASDIAHCVECWWAAHAMFAKGNNLSNFGSTIAGGRNCELKLFKNWGEPWVGFYKEYGDNPFRGSDGKLKPNLAKLLEKPSQGLGASSSSSKTKSGDNMKACVRLDLQTIRQYVDPKLVNIYQ